MRCTGYCTVILLIAPCSTFAMSDAPIPVEDIQQALRRPDLGCNDLDELVRMFHRGEGVLHDNLRSYIIASIEARLTYLRSTHNCRLGRAATRAQGKHGGEPGRPGHRNPSSPPVRPSHQQFSAKEVFDTTYSPLERIVREAQAECDDPAKCPTLPAAQRELTALAVLLLRNLPPDSEESHKVERTLVGAGETTSELLLERARLLDLKLNNLNEQQIALLRSELAPAFNWPPPEASSALKLGDSYLRRPFQQSLGDVDELLTRALDKAGYAERSYFSVANGFALVTRLEQVDANGFPLAGSARWATQVEPLSRFSLNQYLKDLLGTTPGYFRVVVFIITDQPFAEKGVLPNKPNKDDTVGWLHQGVNRLPTSTAKMHYTQQHDCTVLIYEFETSSHWASPVVQIPGKLSPWIHLTNGRILPGLGAP